MQSASSNSASCSTTVVGKGQLEPLCTDGEQQGGQLEPLCTDGEQQAISVVSPTAPEVYHTYTFLFAAEVIPRLLRSKIFFPNYIFTDYFLATYAS